MEATTKKYEVKPDKDGNQMLTIPKSIAGTRDRESDNPIISISDALFRGDMLSFDILITRQQGSVTLTDWSFNQEFTYEEVFTILNKNDYSGRYNSKAANTTDFLAYVMVILPEILEGLIEEVPWLKDKIREYGTPK